MNYEVRYFAAGATQARIEHAKTVQEARRLARDARGSLYNMVVIEVEDENHHYTTMEIIRPRS